MLPVPAASMPFRVDGRRRCSLPRCRRSIIVVVILYLVTAFSWLVEGGSLLTTATSGVRLPMPPWAFVFAAVSRILAAPEHPVIVIGIGACAFARLPLSAAENDADAKLDSVGNDVDQNYASAVIQYVLFGALCMLSAYQTAYLLVEICMNPRRDVVYRPRPEWVWGNHAGLTDEDFTPRDGWPRPDQPVSTSGRIQALNHVVPNRSGRSLHAQ